MVFSSRNHGSLFTRMAVHKTPNTSTTEAGILNRVIRANKNASLSIFLPVLHNFRRNIHYNIAIIIVIVTFPFIPKRNFYYSMHIILKFMNVPGIKNELSILYTTTIFTLNPTSGRKTRKVIPFCSIYTYGYSDYFLFW